MLKDLSQLTLVDCDVQSWRNSDCLVVVESTTLRQGKRSSERRFYLRSADWSAEEALFHVRVHWSIENQQHYLLDVVFCEDSSRTRRGYAAENLGLIRHLALNVHNLDTTVRKSKRRKRLKALLNDAYLLSPLGLSPKI